MGRIIGSIWGSTDFLLGVLSLAGETHEGKKDFVTEQKNLRAVSCDDVNAVEQCNGLLLGMESWDLYPAMH